MESMSSQPAPAGNNSLIEWAVLNAVHEMRCMGHVEVEIQARATEVRTTLQGLSEDKAAATIIINLGPYAWSGPH